MNFTQSKKFNANYATQIVTISQFEPHPNPKVERMKIARVKGAKVLVGIDYQEGKYLYFPPGSVINKDFLKTNNLFRHKELNSDIEKSGYFEDSGRVKMLKLQGVYSEGLVMSLDSLKNWLNENPEYPEECIFDTVNDKQLSKKYVVYNSYKSGIKFGIKSNKPIKKVHESKVLEEQFRFHYETPKLKDTPWIIKPNTLIHVSDKWHGTSGVSAYVLCKDHITLKHKVINFFNKLLSIKEINTHYDYLWSSRKVVKNPYYNEDVNEGFYGVDIWGIAHKIVEPKLTKGLTLYYEIVGYLPNGNCIQSLGGNCYDYGCEPLGEGEEYIYDKHYSIRIYRITYTNSDGIVYEFTARQVHNWCRENGLHAVKQSYYGLAKDMYPDAPIEEGEFSTWFLDKLAGDKFRFMEMSSPDCNNKVPHEGMVIRLEDENIAYKVKCLKFLSGELSDLDKGISNIEDDQCQE